MNRYLSIDDLANNERFPFSKGQIRHFVAKRNENGLATSVRKIGRRIYIREDLFVEWIESFSNEQLQLKIEDLDLSIRPFNALKNSGINTLKDLVSKSKEQILRLRSMGEASYNEVIEMLRRLGLSLKE